MQSILISGASLANQTSSIFLQAYFKRGAGGDEAGSICRAAKNTGDD